MTLTPENVFNIAHGIDGWLDRAETEKLYTLALDIPKKGVVVEIGSYHGKSTVVLALGARERGGTVYTIDPYEGMMDGREVTLHDRDHLRYALTEYGVLDNTTIITRFSQAVAEVWKDPIDLIFIDGSHFYEDVLADLWAWSPHVKGKIACHDHNTNWPGVLMAVAEFVSGGEWKIIEQIDATVVLERA